jgi:hypothetical protein
MAGFVSLAQRSAHGGDEDAASFGQRPGSDLIRTETLAFLTRFLYANRHPPGSSPEQALHQPRDGPSLETLWLEPCARVRPADGRAFPVVAIVPSASGAPAAPAHVILLLGVRISRLMVSAITSLCVTIGKESPVLSQCGCCQRGRKNERGGSKKCEFRHAFLP